MIYTHMYIGIFEQKHPLQEPHLRDQRRRPATAAEVRGSLRGHRAAAVEGERPQEGAETSGEPLRGIWF